jgi:hypothetical protein
VSYGTGLRGAPPVKSTTVRGPAHAHFNVPIPRETRRRNRMAKKPGAEKCTDPEVREQLREEVKAPDKGGRPGQRSARKS